jgi:hypothetical protein
VSKVLVHHVVPLGDERVGMLRDAVEGEQFVDNYLAHSVTS